MLEGRLVKAARAVVGGIATHRERTPQRRGKQLRGYPGTLSGGLLSCRGGAWVKTAGADDDARFDTTRKLIANLGDKLILSNSHGEACSAHVVEIVNPGWNEQWRVEIRGGFCSDGAVVVMKGLKK